ncbi:MAG: biotin--[acetyl-CoA-carboxylase] ligase [Anaerolineaceae bacterium]|nr:biotin--[acetyl-CoA-carboxylase] ligase [Anaerolineaceae bacterium]
MNTLTLKERLTDLGLNEIKYFDRIDSTNTYALDWVENGAADNSLVVADTQTSGKGRMGRQWLTPPQTSLAFSLILRPTPVEMSFQSWFSPLGGLAVATTLIEEYQLPALIKWPNDILIENRKVCGVLAESCFTGSDSDGIILGIGINIAAESVPADSEVRFPATCLETNFDKSIDRIDVLKSTLQNILNLRKIIGSDQFLQKWDDLLAYKNQIVSISHPSNKTHIGKLIGLTKQGNLLLENESSDLIEIEAGDLSLRPQYT